MKKLILSLFAISSLLISCSSDDSSTEPTTNEPSDYISIGEGKFWVYDVSGQLNGRDSLYVSNVQNGISTLKTRFTPTGFYSGLLNEAKLTKVDDKILASGTANYEIIEGFPLNIDIANFAIFKENASNNQQLSTFSDTFETEYDGTPLVFNYTMKSVFVKKHASYDIPNYGVKENVIEMKMVVNLSIHAKFVLDISPNPILIPILSAQDVINSSQFYVSGIGNAYTKTNVNYQLADLSQLEVELPIQSNGNYNIVEKLISNN